MDKIISTLTVLYGDCIKLSGRTRPKLFWLFSGFYLAGCVSLGLIPVIGQAIIGVNLIALSTLSIRRLHDVGLSGVWFLFVILFPYVLAPVIVAGVFYVNNYMPRGFELTAGEINSFMIAWGVTALAGIVLMCLPGTKGENKYGADPISSDERGVIKENKKIREEGAKIEQKNRIRELSLIFMPYRKYAIFSGRAEAEEMKMFSAFFVIGTGLVFLAEDYILPNSFVLTSIFVIASILPFFALLVRRFHDMNLSGLWTIPYITLPSLGMYYGFITNHKYFSTFLVFGSLIFIGSLSFISGTKGNNKYGINPIPNLEMQGA